MKRRHIWCVLTVAALALGASAMPVLAADNGTVNARVVAGGAACLTVSSDVDFGTAQFQPVGSGSVVAGAPSIIVTSCATANQAILARGTDATGTQATWNLTTTTICSAILAQPNQYNLGLRLQGSTDTFLSTTNASISSSLGAGASLTRTPVMRMPCTGSNGTGQTMTMSYVFTATLT